mmetsp:Transcript_15942/g.40507  ORF Transcript_15942/g.40507 Transcript_15942/m.40507 type:complete len:287 (-) Transcript_15942:205-1065(-)
MPLASLDLPVLAGQLLHPGRVNHPVLQHARVRALGQAGVLGEHVGVDGLRQGVVLPRREAHHRAKLLGRHGVHVVDVADGLAVRAPALLPDVLYPAVARHDKDADTLVAGVKVQVARLVHHPHVALRVRGDHELVAALGDEVLEAGSWVHPQLAVRHAGEREAFLEDDSRQANRSRARKAAQQHPPPATAVHQRLVGARRRWRRRRRWEAAGGGRQRRGGALRFPAQVAAPGCPTPQSPSGSADAPPRCRAHHRRRRSMHEPTAHFRYHRHGLTRCCHSASQPALD